MRVESDFFPTIAGELGSSFEDSANLQKRLHDFIPTFQVSNAAHLVHPLSVYYRLDVCARADAVLH